MILEIVKVSATTEYEVKLERGLNLAEFDLLSENEQKAIDCLRERSADTTRRDELLEKSRADQIRILIALIKSIRLAKDGEAEIAINAPEDLPDARLVLALQSQLLVPKVSLR